MIETDLQGFNVGRDKAPPVVPQMEKRCNCSGPKGGLFLKTQMPACFLCLNRHRTRRTDLATMYNQSAIATTAVEAPGK